MNKDTKDKVWDCVCEISRLDFEKEEFRDDLRFIEDLHFDSFDLIKLVVSVEEQFGFSFEDEDLLFENVNSVGGLVSYVESNRDKGGVDE